jgi:type IV pilus assembly protein PilV
MHANHTNSRRRAVRGFGLLDGVVGLVIFSFGLLAMTRFQARMVAASSEVQSRLTATQLSDELISMALVDANNAACYTLPQSGTCTSARAKTQTTAWATRAAAALPGTVTSSATLTAATSRFTVALSWTGKESGESRRLEANTDVR